MRIIGQEQIADVLGCAPKTVVEWQDEGMPVAKRGGPGVPSEYESKDCIDWMIERAVRKAGIERPQDRLARAQAEKFEMENDERRRLLLPASEVEPAWQAMVVWMREQLMSQGHLLAPQLVGRTAPEMRQVIDAANTALLHRFADVDEDALDEALEKDATPNERA